MPGAGWAGVDIAALGATVGRVASNGADDRTIARRERIEDGIQQIDDLLVAADHHAITAFEPPYPA